MLDSSGSIDEQSRLWLEDVAQSDGIAIFASSRKVGLF